ncbi:DUF397 domain-containing protein [Spirillospora sp. NPDC127200]
MPSERMRQSSVMTTWRKSSYSSSDQHGGCVEAAPGTGHVLVRDSKDPGGPRLRLSRTAWNALLGTVRKHWPSDSPAQRQRPRSTLA